MRLYEINQAIADAVAVLDAADGEVNDATEEAYARLMDLQMERDRVLEYLAKLVLNIRSDQVALKAEEERLKSRRKALEGKEDRLIQILDRECAGTKTDLGVATLSYRKSEALEVMDKAKTLEWLRANDHNDCIRIADPEVAKDEVKKLIKNGAEVPGAELVAHNNPSLR